MNSKKFYKVVCRLSSGDLVSRVADYKARIKYVPGKYVFPPYWLGKEHYGPLVFDNLECAIEWARRGCPAGEVWECDVQGEYLSLPPILDVIQLIRGVMWELKTPDKWPPHTVMVRSVKLTELVYSYDE